LLRSDDDDDDNNNDDDDDDSTDDDARNGNSASVLLAALRMGGRARRGAAGVVHGASTPHGCRHDWRLRSNRLHLRMGFVCLSLFCDGDLSVRH
jgi:hypothetical protein